MAVLPSKHKRPSDGFRVVVEDAHRNVVELREAVTR